MGSEQNKRNGLDRRGDGATGYAHQYVIVDLDISAADLAARYAGTKRHAWVTEVIAGAVQRQRTKQPPSDAFVRGLRRARGVDAITIVDLGRDGSKDGQEEDPATGKKRKAGLNHCIVIDGRQRTMSRRINDKLDDADGKAPRMIDADYFVPSAKTPREDVVLLRVGSAIRVPRTISSRAEDAFDLNRDRYSLSDIAPMVEAQDEREVALLITLHECCDEVKAAVDSGLIGLAAVQVLAQFEHAEQARRIARKTAAPEGATGKAARKARDAAAPAKIKARPGRFAMALSAAVQEDISRESYPAAEVAAMLAACAGDDDELHAPGVGDEVRAMVAAALARKASDGLRREPS